MWLSTAKEERLRKAMEFRGIDPRKFDVGKLMDVLVRRGMTDNTLHKIVCQMLDALEPPNCWMTHCEDYGRQGDFCNCSLGRVPGRCGKYRAYMERKRAREERKNCRETKEG